MPVPVELIVNNGSKIRRRIATSIPVPESLTTTVPAHHAGRRVVAII
jgi:hypothetical protein